MLKILLKTFLRQFLSAGSWIFEISLLVQTLVSTKCFFVRFATVCNCADCIYWSLLILRISIEQKVTIFCLHFWITKLANPYNKTSISTFRNEPTGGAAVLPPKKLASLTYIVLNYDFANTSITWFDFWVKMLASS